ncbi:MAG: hypothetical protein KDA65_19605, partial [Planctomycetaceae bacterium]|nr:hypothetical protein [Planctomycetaceae bacterium]
MSKINRREFVGLIGAGAATGIFTDETTGADNNAGRIYETSRDDGRYVETAGALQSYLKHLNPKLAFNSQITAPDFDSWRTSVRDKLLELMCFPDQIPVQPSPKLLWAEQRDGYELQKWEAYPEPYSVVPFLVLVPEGVSSSSPAPAVMCFPGSTSSKESLAGEPELDTGKPQAKKHWETNRQALHYVKRGFVSVAVDNPATCELASSLQPRSSMAECMLWMGRNYLGLSVFQKASILKWLSERPIVDSNRIATSG